MENNQSNNDNGNSNNNQGGNNNNKKRPSATLIILILSVLMTLAFWQTYSKFKDSGKEQITYDEFLAMLDEGNVQNVKIYSNEITFEPAEQDENAVYEVSYSVVRTDDYELIERLDKAGVTFEEIDEGGNVIVQTILSYGIMIVAFYLLMMLIMKSATKSGGVMGVGKSNAKMYVQTETGVTFKDVAGQEEAKESLSEMVDFLEKPERYLQIGAKLPFFSLSGSDFVELYVGVGASRVRDLFKRANAMAPCIIFIDEIDAIGRSRDTRHSGGDSEREQTLNQLLSEMDGFDTSKGIVVLAATNRPEVLDKALLRPGRFDRRIIVSKPDLQGRIDTLKVHSKDVKMDQTVNLRELALATAGAVGADLANIINEAALLAVRNRRDFVSQADLLGSVEVVFAGKEKKEKLLSPKEKEIVAYHEVGHALVSALQKNTLPIQRITIVPRTGGALGYVWQVPEEEKQLESKKELEEEIVICLAGRAAEELKFDSVTSGAANDIEKATSIARTMITMYGMSDKFGMVQLESVTGQYLDNRRVLNCSSETETKVDTEVKNMIKASYEKAIKLLKKNMTTLDAIAKVLYEKENLTGDEFMKLYEKHQNVRLKNTAADDVKAGTDYEL